MKKIYTTYGIASNMFFAYCCRQEMKEEEKIIKLAPQQEPMPAEQVTRLDQFQKNRTDKSIDSLRKNKTPVVRVITEETPDEIKEDDIVLEGTKRQHFEGKSVDYTIDEILQPNQYDTDTHENDWGSNEKKIPIGWVVLLALTIIIFVGFICISLFSGKGQKEVINLEKNKILIDEETEISTAQRLVKEIDRTVRSYIQAATIEEKLRYVRHPEAMKSRMESYYSRHPLKAAKVGVVTDYKPLTLDNTLFWGVIAEIDANRGEALLVEQIAEDEVKIDWESHVNYQPMAWDQYATEQPTTEMAFRVSVEPTVRYLAEFSNESRWVCYRLQAKDSELSLYGYVQRNSEAHLLIQQRVDDGGSKMILRLQFAKSMKAKQSVVITKVVSPNIYRISPPSSTSD
jgi:hypothetical protein